MKKIFIWIFCLVAAFVILLAVDTIVDIEKQIKQNKRGVEQAKQEIQKNELIMKEIYENGMGRVGTFTIDGVKLDAYLFRYEDIEDAHFLFEELKKEPAFILPEKFIIDNRESIEHASISSAFIALFKKNGKVCIYSFCNFSDPDINNPPGVHIGLLSEEFIKKFVTDEFILVVPSAK